MMRRIVTFCCLNVSVAWASLSVPACADVGTPELQSVGPLAFTPNGILLVGDAKAATIFAIETGDVAGNPDLVEINLPKVNEKIAGLLGTVADEVRINDLAVNPASGNVYLSVSRGRGPDAVPVLLKIDNKGQMADVPLDNVEYTSVALPNAPDASDDGQNRRRGNARMESITDLAYLDGTVFVAGLSNEEFASKLRKISYPFDSAGAGTSVEIFHGAHGRYETRSPVRHLCHLPHRHRAALAGRLHLHATGEIPRYGA